MAAGDAFNRWSQIVRGPGSVIIQGHHATELPAEGDIAPGAPGRPATRLLCHPVGLTGPIHMIDITSSAVCAMLEGYLRSGVGIGKVLSWQSRGYGRQRRDTVWLTTEIRG